MHDSKILSACIASREAYDRAAPHVDTNEFTPTAAFWWRLVRDWYKLDDKAQAIDRELLRGRGKREAPTKHESTMLEFYDRLPEPISPENVIQELLEIKRFARGQELAGAITGANDRKEVRKLLGQYDELLGATDLARSEVQYAASLDELDDVISDEARLPLSPPSLNEKCRGGALPGHFIVLFGTPEVGKTSFAINQTCNWLRGGYRGIYIGNEDPINSIKERMRCNLANMTAQQATLHKEVANRRARERGLEDRLFMVRMTPGTPAEIEELLREHEPDFLVLDQLRNVGGGGENMTQRLNQVAIDIRNLLGKYGVVGLGIAQATAGERGKKAIWYESDDIDSSRIGIPAQADLLLGIGADDSMLAHSQRAISLCKNKLGGEHDGIIVNVDRMRSKVF